MAVASLEESGKPGDKTYKSQTNEAQQDPHPATDIKDFPKYHVPFTTMKFNLASIFGTVLAAGAAFNIAYAHSDRENVNFARNFVDELSTRSSSVEVPFQHSLREFLEGAVSAHRRALDSDYGADLEARSTYTVEIGLGGSQKHHAYLDGSKTASAVLAEVNHYYARHARSLNKADGTPVKMSSTLAKLFPGQAYAELVMVD
ncbi:hypothetical protein DFP72DRAFT_1173990 [Ephemerocybe angulata]|uniref:Uncharacterized protein n=1 Tax=Ephemerocybe angulata TaxID=980116 RepID=A0A8H6HLS5_9AGAR|nr:hypothetical protein DFP72DRAFT_1173990 [Tulosesus angulatus]